MTPDPSSRPPMPPLPPEAGPSCPPWAYRRGRLGRAHGRGPGAIVAVTVIAWGALLLLRELGFVSPAVHAMDFWPVVLVGLGLSILLRRRSVGGALVGAAVAVVGAGMLAERLGYVELGMHRLWPVVIIAAGVAMLLRGPSRHRRWHTSSGELTSADLLERNVTMGTIKLAVDSQQFKGARLGATMGEVQADLRRAAMAGDEAVVEVSVVMGGVELYVPPHWQVVSDLSPLMGTVEDKTDARPDAAGVQKRLVIRGSITMGAVTVSN